jgi:hypothetical protein
MKNMTNVYTILGGILNGRDHLDDLGVDGRIILERILNKVEKCGLDSSASGS